MPDEKENRMIERLNHLHETVNQDSSQKLWDEMLELEDQLRPSPVTEDAVPEGERWRTGGHVRYWEISGFEALFGPGDSAPRAYVIDKSTAAEIAHAMNDTPESGTSLGAPSTDENVRCTCEWASSASGVISQGWPAELDPQCFVHGAPNDFARDDSFASFSDLFHSFILESTGDEIREALGDRFEDLAERGRAALDAALSEVAPSSGSSEILSQKDDRKARMLHHNLRRYKTTDSGAVAHEFEKVFLSDFATLRTTLAECQRERENDEADISDEIAAHEAALAESQQEIERLCTDLDDVSGFAVKLEDRAKTAEAENERLREELEERDEDHRAGRSYRTWAITRDSGEKA